MSTINVPAKTLTTLIDIDNPKLVVSSEDMMKLVSESENNVRTFFTMPVEEHHDHIEHDICYLNKFTKQPITIFNPNIKYWEMTFKFYNDSTVNVIIPNFIKFYSLHKEQFIPVDFIKKSDILVDYRNNMVQITKKVELPNIDLNGEEYYSISLSSSNEGFMNQFYLNGILATIPYNSYSKE